MTFANLTSLHGRRAGLVPETTGGGIVIVRPDGSQDTVGCFRTVTVTSAQLLALFATPQTIVAAPGAGLALVVNRVAIYKPAGTAYAGIAAGEDLVLKYTNASGVQVCGVIETTGFLDQTTAQTAVAFPVSSTGATAGSYLLTTNAALVLHLLVGEITTGDQPLYVRVWYDVLSTVFTS